MRTFLVILGIVIIVLVLAVILLPIFFKPQIVALAKEEINKNVNARVEFENIGLNLVQHFPNATLTVDKAIIINKAPFDGDTLASVKQFQVTMNLSKLILRRQVEIRGLQVMEPRITARVLKDGQANWDIFPRKPIQPTPAPGKPSSLNIAIKDYVIKDGYLSFVNEAANVSVKAAGIQHEGKGDFKQQNFTLSTTTDIPALTVIIGNTVYLSDTHLNAKLDIALDKANKKFTFSKNEIKLNDLALAFDGWVAMADQETQVDMTFSSPKAEFKSLLSMIPAIYRKNFDKLKAEGQMSLAGKVQGTYSKTQVPTFDIGVNVANGMFQYSGLPTPVKQVNLDLQIQNPGKTLNETVIDLKKLHFEIMNEPMDIQLSVKTPVSDPYLDGTFKGAMDLAQVANVFPLGKDTRLGGRMTMDIVFKGNKSALDNQKAGQVTANGKMAFSNVEYVSPTLPAPVQISSASLSLSPQQASLDNFIMVMGKSDLKANGSLQNVFGYVFSKQDLIGSLVTQSNNFDLNPFMQQKGGPLKAVELPGRVRFLMTSTFNNIALMNMNLTNVRGKLLLKDKVLTLVDLNAIFLGGNIVSNGSYKYMPPALPHIDMALDVSKLSIPDMFKTLTIVKAFAPVAEYMTGDVSGKLSLDSDLGDSLTPIISSLIGKGSLDIPNASIQNFPPLEKIGDALKLNILKNPTLSALSPSFDIKDGRFILKPVVMKLAGYQVEASGSNGIDKSLDYTLKINVPAGELKSAVNSAISGLIGRDVQGLTNETIVVNVGVKGTVSNPQVGTSLGQIVKGPAEQINQAVKQEAQKQKEEIQKQVEQKIDSLKKTQEEALKDKIKGIFK